MNPRFRPGISSFRPRSGRLGREVVYGPGRVDSNRHGGQADGAIVGVKSVFVTGSVTGLGLEAAAMLVESGHRVVLHARSEERAAAAAAALPAAAAVVVGDLAVLSETIAVAEEAAENGPFDAVIHNAGIYQPGASRMETVDGLESPVLRTVLQ